MQHCNITIGYRSSKASLEAYLQSGALISAGAEATKAKVFHSDTIALNGVDTSTHPHDLEGSSGRCDKLSLDPRDPKPQSNSISGMLQLSMIASEAQTEWVQLPNWEITVVPMPQFGECRTNTSVLSSA